MVLVPLGGKRWYGERRENRPTAASSSFSEEKASGGTESIGAKEGIVVSKYLKALLGEGEEN